MTYDEWLELCPDEAITKYHQGKWYDYSVSDFTDTHKLIEIREETE